MFLGEYEIQLDEKNRLILPEKFADILREEKDMVLLYYGNRFKIMSKSVYERYLNQESEALFY